MNPPRNHVDDRGRSVRGAFRPKIVRPYHYRPSNLQEFTDALKGVPVNPKGATASAREGFVES